MTSVVQHLYSTTADEAPVAEGLMPAQIAVCIPSRRLYIGDGGNVYRKCDGTTVPTPTGRGFWEGYLTCAVPTFAAPEPDPPTINGTTVTAQSGDILTLSVSVSMATTGSEANQLTVDIFDELDTELTTVLGSTTVSTGIGLGDTLSVDITGVDGIEGDRPRTLLPRATAT